MDLGNAINIIAKMANDRKIITIGDDQYSTEEFSRIEPEGPPLAPCIVVTTLSGLLELITEKVDDLTVADWILHVVNPTEVRLIQRKADTFGRRHVLAKADLPNTEGFKFGAFHDHDPFTIALLSNFQKIPDDDLEYLIRISSNITAEQVTTSANDGISQKVGMRTGVAMVQPDGEVLRTRLKLAPFRTFTEVDQPLSDFVFRAQSGGGPNTVPKLALFEADGQRWKKTAMDNIATYLSRSNTTIAVVS